MISEVTIENFKSIQKLELGLGRVTVLIGANGCGKSNIIEAIAFAGAAAADKLDHEFLAPRGIRVPDDSRFMRSAFESQFLDKDVHISIRGHEMPDHEDLNISYVDFDFVLRNMNDSPYSRWKDISLIASRNRATQRLKLIQEVKPEYLPEIENEILYDHDIETVYRELSRFFIYAPENTILRRFEEEGQIQPLGIKGEGLFKLLTVLHSEENKERLADIKFKLKLLDWFGDFGLGSNAALGERSLRVRDKYIDSDLESFTQKSANEGFLYLLFYFALFTAKETPAFFAIDNIDASLNPKLCRQLIKELVSLAKKYGKQAVITTHNPAILDGLNLNDDEQRLFVVYRNVHGHTKAERILKGGPVAGEEPVRMSEAFLRGYIGGLPENF